MTEPGPDGHVPDATFLNFLSGLGAQALMQVGAMPNPLTGDRTVNPPYARYTLQLLRILKDKTEGRRTDEEERYLNGMIADLDRRMAGILPSATGPLGS